MSRPEWRWSEMLRVSSHAIERYQERIANVSDDEARAALSSRAIQLAASFGARFVRLATGHRVAIADNTVTTVLPPMHHKRQVHRVGLGRFGNGQGGWGSEE